MATRRVSKHTNHSRKLATSKAPSAKAKTKSRADFTEIVLTIREASGGIVKVEKLDNSGRRHALTDQQFFDLLDEDDIDDILAEAYSTSVAHAFA